jgi:uncharacterized protein
MEDILASIRRILSEDESPAPVREPPAADNASGDEGVLVLDPGMMVPDPSHEAEAVAEPPAEIPPPPTAELTPTLVAPATAAASASSVGSLMRTLAERTRHVHSGGPTIEDIVREELRPLLKAWLDLHLPPLVERVVRAEIERVVSRSVL